MTIYRTGRGLSALIQRLRLWRCYARPVTFADLRRIAYDAQAQGGTAEDVFAAVIAEAEAPVFGGDGPGKSANGFAARPSANVDA
jgi:hypothetical protein